MSVSQLTKTVALNPAFLEEIKDSNLELWAVLGCVRETCDRGENRVLLLRDLVQTLNQLRDLVALQFALEESYGFVEISTWTSPDLMMSIDHVRSQHIGLYLRISELAECAEEMQYRGAGVNHISGLVARILVFELQLMDHERAERALIKSWRSESQLR